MVISHKEHQSYNISDFFHTVDKKEAGTQKLLSECISPVKTDRTINLSNSNTKNNLGTFDRFEKFINSMDNQENKNKNLEKIKSKSTFILSQSINSAGSDVSSEL